MEAVDVGLGLLRDVDTLVPHIIDQIWDRIPGYSAPWINRQDLENGVANVTVGVLRAFTGLEGDISRELETARELGATRALQGVNLESVVQSFRRVERVLSEAFVSGSAGMEVEELRAGLQRLAAGFDELSAAAIAAYQDIQQSVGAHVGNDSSGFVTALLSGSMEPSEIAERASLLELDPDATYQSLAMHVGESPSPQRRAQLQRRAFHGLPSGKGGRSLMSPLRDADLFVVPAAIGEVTLEALSRSLFSNAGHPVWLALGAPYPGLHNAARSAHQAMEAVRIAVLSKPPQTVTRFDEVLLDVLLLHAETATSRLVTLLHEPLARHPHLLETVGVFLEEDMSIRACAERLFVHTNTVAYRLRRIHELTGVDPRDPLELVRIRLAIRAKRLRDAAADAAAHA